MSGRWLRAVAQIIAGMPSRSADASFLNAGVRGAVKKEHVRKRLLKLFGSSLSAISQRSSFGSPRIDMAVERGVETAGPGDILAHGQG